MQEDLAMGRHLSTVCVSVDCKSQDFQTSCLS